MAELLKALINPFWQLFMPIPMPWRSVIILLMLITIGSWLFLRLFPWLFIQISKLLLLIKLPTLILKMTEFIGKIFLYPEYLITQNSRKKGLNPPEYVYIYDDIVTGIVNTINQLSILLDKILTKITKVMSLVVRKRWAPRRQYSLFLSVFLVFAWFIRPQLDDKNQLATLIDGGTNSWYSLEKWLINGEWKSTTLNNNSPKEFIKDYFDALNTQNYIVAWNSLTPEYKSKKSLNYKKFLDWWGNEVERANVHGISLKSKNSKSANLNISMQYFMREKRKLSKTELIRYQLSWDAQEKRWLINDSNSLDK
ncbi:serine/threonine protein kinase [Calothrix sp. NIES-4071]|nr:serine/threonine protein kinase [Calothrix sp. NIES-4071]BAZ57379.1 serine/threonine protein kinase [Calothrix sp. NIES-4105]